MTQSEFFARYIYDTDTALLGGGGFGSVYKAFDDERDVFVAIKVSQVKPGQEHISLQKEVELAAILPGHKNIAHYQNCYRFKTPQGTFDYGILQYYPDGNLSQLIKKQNLSHTQKESIAHGIINGIDHLHRHEIVHRDLKSSNILISKRDNGEYVPKVADFGLSKQFAVTDKSYFSNSFAGGSLHYVAPEQLVGGQIRKNVDLWGLGVILFELFTGQLPFEPTTDTGTETARAEIVNKIFKGTLPDIIYSVPGTWQSVVRACLITDANRRVKSVAEIIQLLWGEQRQNPKENENKIATDQSTIINVDNSAYSSTAPHTGVSTTFENRINRDYTWPIIFLTVISLGILFSWLFPRNENTSSDLSKDSFSQE
jgi:serine/threonine protein kinase